MTAATSMSKKSFFGVRYRSKIAENKKLLIVNSVLELIGLPLIACMILYTCHIAQSTSSHYSYNSTFDADAIMIVSIISIFLSILSGVVIALFSFRYLYTKSLVDMNYSLPLTSKQRFFADYLAGLTIYIAPAAAAAILSLIILGIGSAFIDLSDFWEIFPILLPMGITVLLGMIMLYTLTVFTTTICGATFEAVFAMIAVNVIIPATIVCAFLSVSEAVAYGLTGDSLLYNQALTTTSPAGVVVFLVAFVEKYIIDETAVATMYIRWLIPFLIVMAIYLFGAMLLYIRRKAESVSKPYVYKGFYYTIVTLGVFCVLSPFIAAGESITAGIIICAIIYFLLEVISKRGFRRFWASALRYAGTVVAVCIFCELCKTTDGFGLNNYVPGVNSISSVEIYMYGQNYGFNKMVSFEAPDVINEAVELHKELIDRYDDPDEYTKQAEKFRFGELKIPDNVFTEPDDSYIDLTYNMKNGSTILREYMFSSDMTDELYTAIMLSEEFAEYQSTELALECFNYSSDIYYSSYDDVYKSMHGTAVLSDCISRDIDEKRMTYQDIDALRKAYKQDWLAMTEDELKNAPIYGYINGRTFWIKDTFTNTIAFLEQKGFADTEITLENLMESAHDDLRIGIFTEVMVCNSMNSIIKNKDTYYYDIVETPEYVIQDKVTRGYPTYASDELTVPVSDFEGCEEIVKLLKKATPIIIGDMPAGAICIDPENNSTYAAFIPDTEENRELLDKLYDEYIEGKAIGRDVYYSYYD